MVSFSLTGRPLFVLAARADSPTPRRRMTSALTLAASVGVPLGLGQVMGIWSVPDVATWFPQLEKPSWTPPVWAFPPIWTVLYTCMGVASHRAWAAGAGPGTLGLYAAQLALNLAWQPLFFKAHNLKAAAQDISALVPVLALTAWQFSKYDALAGKLMVPYLLFSCYAAALTVSILRKNGEKVD